DEVLVVDSDSTDGTAAIEREGSQSLGGAAMAMKKEIFNMGMPWESGYGYSQAVKVGDTIYVSGQVDHDEPGKVLYPGDMGRQMRQAYANDKRVLAHFGATMDNIVDEVFLRRRTGQTGPSMCLVARAAPWHPQPIGHPDVALAVN